MLPEIEYFRRQLAELRSQPMFAHLIDGDYIRLGELTSEDVASLMQNDVLYYFLIAAAGLNRTSLRRAAAEPDLAVVAPRLRKAVAVKQRLIAVERLGEITSRALALRQADLARRAHGSVEQLFRDRLREENIPLLMSPPVRQVPGLLIGRRKPDGVFPDPNEGPPLVYLEIKSVRRVADDIQKRLYEVAEASIEMKLLYSSIRLTGLDVRSPIRVHDDPSLRARLRKQILRARPTVVALFLCSRNEAQKYRDGAEAFVDRLFFQEEIDDCIAFLRLATVGVK